MSNNAKEPMNRPALLGAMLALSCLVVAFAVLSVQGPVRLLTVLAFALVAPGVALVSWWRSLDTATAWLAAVASSVSIVIMLATFMVAVGAWNPVLAMTLLAMVTGAVLGLQIWRGRSAASTSESTNSPEMAPQ
jgi:predicted neutral ceramidase superfamily lipid hydrolase